MSEEQTFHSGFVGIVGPTNSGKSTLLNALMGRKVSIVSPKVQTTYHGVRAIRNAKNEQVIFTDTPGFQGNRERVAKLLNDVADKNADGCDMLLWVFDVTKNPLAHIETLIDRIKSKPVERSFCLLNKVDSIAKLEVLPLIDTISKMGIFAEVIPISALKSVNLDPILKVIRQQLPEGPQLYPPEMITDRPTDFQITEFIREKLYHLTYQEMPYSAWIEIERWGEHEPKTRVPTYRAIIHVESDSKKGILIGKRGEMLKRIGTMARKDIEKWLGHQVCLKLFVDVHSDWKADSTHLNRYLELQ